MDVLHCPISMICLLSSIFFSCSCPAKLTYSWWWCQILSVYSHFFFCSQVICSLPLSLGLQWLLCLIAVPVLIPITASSYYWFSKSCFICPLITVHRSLRTVTYRIKWLKSTGTRMYTCKLHLQSQGLLKCCTILSLLLKDRHYSSDAQHKYYLLFLHEKSLHIKKPFSAAINRFSASVSSSTITLITLYFNKQVLGLSQCKFQQSPPSIHARFPSLSSMKHLYQPLELEGWWVVLWIPLSGFISLWSAAPLLCFKYV